MTKKKEKIHILTESELMAMCKALLEHRLDKVAGEAARIAMNDTLRHLAALGVLEQHPVSGNLNQYQRKKH